LLIASRLFFDAASALRFKLSVAHFAAMVGFGKKRTTATTVDDGSRSAGTGTGRDGVGMSKGHKSAIAHSNVFAFIAFCGWGACVVALAVLQHDCSSGVASGTAISGLAATNTLALFQPVNSCRDIYGFTWWALALELFALLLCIAAIWTPHFRKHRPGCVAILAISTVISMIYTNTFLAFGRLTTGGNHRRAYVLFAGFLVYTAANMLLIIALGRYENDHPVTTAVYDHPSADYNRGGVAGLDNNGVGNTGPAINPVRGYAGPTPGNGTPVLHTDRNIV